MRLALYAAACIVLPSVWAIVMYHAFDWLERRRAAARGDTGRDVDYTI